MLPSLFYRNTGTTMKRKSFILLSIFVLSVTTLFSSPPDWEPIQGTQYSMVLFGEIYLYSVTFTGTDSSNIAAAFGPGGELDCRSIGAWQPDNPPYWDGYWYFTIVGNDNGDPISFKIYNSNNDSVYNCNETINFEDGTTTGNPVNPYNLTVGQISVNYLISGTLGVSTYPNPFSHTITFDLSQMQEHLLNLSIYDIKGRLIRKFTNNDFNDLSILNWTGFDSKGKSISPGIYFYKIETSKINSLGKIIYLQ